jgi:hypothetical protein
MLTETTAQRAQSLALEQLEQDALEKRLKLDEKDKDAVKAAVGELEKAKRLSLTAKDIGAAFTQTFDDIVLGAKSASQAVQAMLMDIARALVHNLITQPIGDTLSAAISHWLIGTVTVPAADANGALAHTAHSGWQVGSAGGATRRVPAGLFWAAPRLHSGLASDEFPAILQSGETVLSRAQSAAALHPSLTVNVTNTSAAPVNARVTDLKLDLRRLVVGILLEDQQTCGPITRGYRR